MVLVELAAEVSDCVDSTDRYFTIETQPIDNNWYNWPNRVLVSPNTRGRFYARQVDLQPGSVTIWVGVNNFTGIWSFRITAKVVSTGQMLLDVIDFHSTLSFVHTFTFTVPDVPGGGGGGGGTTPDISKIIKDMMEQILPPMMQIMGMMMMMSMMASMMQSMVGAIGGVF